MYEYKGRIVNVVDGDTYDAVLELGFYISHRIRIRLKDLDTPEIYRPENDAELEHGRAARDYVRMLVEKNPDVRVRTYKQKATSFGRFVADITITDADGIVKDLKHILIDQGFVKRPSYTE